MKKFITLMTAGAIVLGGLTSCSTGNTSGRNRDRDRGRNEESSGEEETETETGIDNSKIDEPESSASAGETNGITGNTRDIPATPTELGTWKQEILEQVTIPGRWTIPESVEITPDLSDIFSEVRTSGELGENDYVLQALVDYLPSTADDSCSYCFLCQGCDEATGVEYPCLIFVYDDGEGNIELCNIFNFELQQAYESDLSESYLPTVPDHQGIWTLSESVEIPQDVLDAYNSAVSPDGLYDEPLAFLGEGEIDGMQVYCLVTTNCLYMASNNGLALSYVAHFNDGSWVVLKTTSFDVHLINECPEPSLSEEITTAYPIFTYGGWTVPASWDISGLPSEVIELIGEYEDGSYEPLAYVDYKEYLHPDCNSLLRVVLCSVNDEYTAFVFVEEDEAGQIAVTGTCTIDIDDAISSGAVRSSQEAPAAGGWEIPSSGEIPEGLTEATEAYQEYVQSIGGFADFDEPEYLIGVKMEDGVTTYAFICRQGIFRYGGNDAIMIGTAAVYEDGSTPRFERSFVIMDDIVPSITGEETGASVSEEGTLPVVFDVVSGIDVQLACAIEDEVNHDGNERHANENGIDLVIDTFDSHEEARASWDSWHDTFEDSIVFTRTNYFLFDSMGDGNLFGYVFVSGNDVVIVMTGQLGQVTTVAEIGDTLAETL